MFIQQSYIKHSLKSTHDFLVTSSLIKYSIWYQVASFQVHVTIGGGKLEAQDTKGKHINNATPVVTIGASHNHIHHQWRSQQSVIYSSSASATWSGHFCQLSILSLVVYSVFFVVVILTS